MTNYDFKQNTPFKMGHSDLKAKGRGHEVNQAVSDLKTDPKSKSNMLKGAYEGVRTYTVGNTRVLFAICPECIQEGHVDFIDCYDCEQIHGKNQHDPKEVVKLLNVEDITPISPRVG